MPNNLLPGYTWDKAVNRYRSRRTGRYVARRRIVALLEQQVTAGEDLLADLVTSAHEEQTDASAFAEQMRSQLKRMHLQNASIGAGGWDRMTPADFGRVGGRLRSDYGYIERFAKQIQDGEVTLPQALNRTRQYVGNSRKQFWDADRARIITPDGQTTLERRDLGSAEHCEDCVGYHGQGWQTVGSLPIPGEGSVCRSNCKCGMSRTGVPQSNVAEWIGTRRRR